MSYNNPASSSSSSANNTSSSGKPNQPYHIQHGATAYQQITARGDRQPLLFSQSGYDVIGVLTRVAARPNPTVFIGSVDFSCAFIVADAQDPECPIRYVSPPLTKMTGYEEKDFLGHSCRFLQWPNGGRTKESHPSNEQSRNDLKHAIENNLECQTSLVNYRKNGEMFINFVTIVPITWDSDEVRFWVGFQVDMSEAAGLYRKMNERIKDVQFVPVPTYAQAPVSDRLLDLVGPAAESPEDRREKVFDFLLDNLDDFTLSISSDGIIHHVGGQIHSSVGWRAEDLAGQSIDTFVHPADIEKVSDEIASFRRLDPLPRMSSSVDIAAHYAKQNRLVHIFYRGLVRSNRQSTTNAGADNHAPGWNWNRGPFGTPAYVWLESTGRIHIDSPGKSFVILATRVVHLPRLSFAQVSSVGGFNTVAVGSSSSNNYTSNPNSNTPSSSNPRPIRPLPLRRSQTSCWLRVSLDGGLILSISPASSCIALLNATPEQVVGTRLNDWVSYEFVASVEGLFSDLRGGGGAKKGLGTGGGKGEKARQITAMMPAGQSPSVDTPMPFGKPLVITLFPPEPPVIDGSGSGDGTGSSTQSVPLHKPTSWADAMPPVPRSGSGDSSGESSNDSSSNNALSSGADKPPTPPPRALGSSSSVPSTVICRLSAPVQVLPEGMLGASGEPLTNQAYLYDPFGAIRPLTPLPAPPPPPRNSYSNASLNPDTYLNFQTAPPPPPTSTVHSHNSNPNTNSQSTSTPSRDIFDSLSALSDSPNGNPRWEDQLEVLRVQNARMQREIDELLSAQQQPRQHGSASGTGSTRS